MGAAGDRAALLVERLRDGSAGPTGQRILGALGVVTPVGWTVAGLGVVAWIAGWQLGWHELMVVAALCLLLLLLAGAYVARRSTLQVELRLNPVRVEEGDDAVGEIKVTNTAARRSAAVVVEVPVGAGVVPYTIGELDTGESTDEVFVVPTSHRGVVVVGPATSVRADPLGLLRRVADGSAAVELMVHPLTTPLDPFGSGLLRDLEGLTTKDLSASDLAFHALREYAPGDDRRHIHWRSSAKLGPGKLLVRQYLDTRRSTLCVVVDTRAASYAEPDELEVALQVAGSIARRACRDELSAVMIAGAHAAEGHLPHAHLDVLARAELGRGGDLQSAAVRAAAKGSTMSVAILLSGSLVEGAEIQRAATRFPPEVRVLGVRIVPGQQPAITGGGRATVVRLASLDQLPSLLRSEAVA